MNGSRIGLLVVVMLIAVLVRPAASDTCRQEERDAEGKCPKKPATPSPRPQPVKAPEKPAPDMPAPPAELDAMAKTLVGTWRCTGVVWDNNGVKAAMMASSTFKLQLGNWWLTETTEAKGFVTFTMIAYTTYDTSSKKWHRLVVMNGGSRMIGTSDGMKDNKMTWNMDVSSPVGAGMFREHIDMTDLRVGLKNWSEISLDKGKYWNKIHEMTCKR